MCYLSLKLRTSDLSSDEYIFIFVDVFIFSMFPWLETFLYLANRQLVSSYTIRIFEPDILRIWVFDKSKSQVIYKTINTTTNTIITTTTKS